MKIFLTCCPVLLEVTILGKYHGQFVLVGLHAYDYAGVIVGSAPLKDVPNKFSLV